MKKWPAKYSGEVGEVRRPPATFENPGYNIIVHVII